MENIIDTLITDRTQADVERAKYLNSLWDARARRWTGTQEEWAEWSAGPRGAYGFADMNRVEEAVAYLVGRLRELGYSVADAGDVVPAFNIRLSIRPEGGGEAMGGGIFYQGDTATVTAAPSGKHDFVGWMENGSVVSTEQAYTFTVGASRDLTAVFALKKYTVTVSTDPEGSGETTGGGVYDVDTVVAIAAQAGEGYAFARWTQDGEPVGDGPEYSFTLEHDVSFVAVMTKLHVILVSAGEDGGGTVSGGGTYLDGQTVTVAAVAGDGYVFAGWQEDGKTVSTDEVYTFPASADRTLTAAFVRLYTVTLLVEPDGSGTAYGGGVYRAGERVTVSAAPEDGQRFVAWMENGAQAGTDAEYSFTVDGDTTLTARFEAVPVYAVSVGVGPEQDGFGTATGAGEYREGTYATVRAEAAEGYVFSEWQEGGGTVSRDAEYTFLVTGPRELTAVFKKFSRLPEGYTEVEYIQSEGYCYINTGILPYTQVTTNMDVEPLSATGNGYFFYSYKAGTTAYYYRCYYTSSAIRANMGSGTASSPGTKTIVSNPVSERMAISYNPKEMTVSVNSNSVTFSNHTLATTMPSIYLLGGTSSNYLSAKLYSCQMLKQNVDLARDFVPCIDPSGAVGLYDLVEGAFYANSGTGTLTAGPAV